MKKQKSLEPIVITSHPMLYVSAAFFLLFSPFMLWLAISQTESGTRLLCMAMFLLDVGLGVAFLLTPRARKITVSKQGVTIEQKRGSIHAYLPCDNYNFMYTLHGYKVCYFLFSPVALNKQAQYAACEACRQAKDVPFVHDGCLALTGVVTLHMQEVIRYLPEHIHVAPEHECGTLWNKGKGL